MRPRWGDIAPSREGKTSRILALETSVASVSRVTVDSHVGLLRDYIMSIYKLLVWWISGIYRWSMYHHRCVQLLAML